jgi:hypothetical protein
MNAMDIEQFVAASAQALDLMLDPEQCRRVAAVFARNADMARLVMEFDLPASTEPAPVFTP